MGVENKTDRKNTPMPLTAIEIKNAQAKEKPYKMAMPRSYVRQFIER